MNRLLPLLALAFTASLSWSAAAQEKVDPNEVTTGTVRFETNTEWVRFEVDGAALESDDGESQVFFEDEGKTLLIGGITRTADHVIKLIPTTDDLKWEEITITPKEWKLTKVDKNTREWRVNKVIKFRKWNPGEKEKLQTPPTPPVPDAAQPAAPAAPAEPAAPADPAAPTKPEAAAPEAPATPSEGVAPAEPAPTPPPEAPEN